jgi:hypothetical protein
LVAVLMLAALLWKETETSASTASISPSIKLYVGALCSGKGHGVDEVLLAGRGGEERIQVFVLSSVLGRGFLLRADQAVGLCAAATLGWHGSPMSTFFVEA